MSSAKDRSYIALVGAYERDNFGDILFLNVCRKLLHPWPIVPLSIVSRDMSMEGAGTVISASAWFNSCGDDFLPKSVIVCGGEVLTSSISSAFPGTLDKKKHDLFYRADTTTRRLLGELISSNSGQLAYVPNLSNLLGPMERDVSFALNSIGGSSLGDRPTQLEASITAVKQATYTSVRDRVTHKILTTGVMDGAIIHLDPDIVSALKLYYQTEVDTAFTNALSLHPWLSEPYTLFQANDGYLKQRGLEAVGQAIAEIATSLTLNVVFQPAGIAPGHDSIERLGDLAKITASLCRGGTRVHTETNRNVWSQVALIAHTACFVGTSLHGRIVSGAFSRPRVGLENEKVTTYASTWEETHLQPYNVAIADLKVAVASAMSVDADRLSAYAENQANLALTGFQRLRQTLNLTEFAGDQRAASETIARLGEKALLRENERLRSIAFDFWAEVWQTREEFRLKAGENISLTDRSRQILLVARRALGRLSSKFIQNK
ncbi:MAG: polysaccharide pyruvyl transferase family protein [Rubrivivax sp.]|nr:polysaccharide pyruvyl transferase family protein [Rubrivivax sp.]